MLSLSTFWIVEVTSTIYVYLQEYCEWILYKWTINVPVGMPTLLIGHLGWNWTREWEKLKQKPACAKKLNSFSSKRPKKEPACLRPFQSRATIKMNKIHRAGTFPELPEKADFLLFKMPWRLLELISTAGWTIWETYMFRHHLISLRILIFKTRSNPAIRKHNTVLRCYLLRWVYDFKNDIN